MYRIVEGSIRNLQRITSRRNLSGVSCRKRYSTSGSPVQPRESVKTGENGKTGEGTKTSKGGSSPLSGVVGAVIGGGVVGAGLFLWPKEAGWKKGENLRSTTPLDQLTEPSYATDDEFKQAILEITAQVGSDNVSDEASVVSAHADSFFTTHHPPDPEKQRPQLVVYPSSTEQVSEILKIANKYRVPIVASSGLTSLEGQYMHTRGPNSLSLSFTKMDSILEFHPEDLDVVVQPGVGWQDLESFLQEREDGKHLMFGPDPGMGATIAGMVATSASGTNAFKYGTMKENVVNVTVVLADGTVVKTKQRPRKSSAGYDMTRLFIGSEGTLGIITEITVKLHVKPIKELVTIAAFPTVKDAAATAQELLAKHGLQPNAIEILNSTTMSFVNASTSDKDSGGKLFLEKPTLFFKLGGASKRAIEEQMATVKEVGKKNNIISIENSADEDENQVLWYARRNGLWSTYEFGSKVLDDKDDVQVWTTDIAVPLSHLSQVIGETNDELEESNFHNRFSLMGHIGDGNCHFILLYNTKDYGKAQKMVDNMVYRAIKYGGTCTGEHGVGVGKRKYLETELGTSTVDLMRHIKLSLDPNRILNPDKVFKIDPKDNLDELLEVGEISEVGKQSCCH